MYGEDPKVARLRAASKELIALGNSVSSKLVDLKQNVDRVDSRWDLPNESKARGKRELWAEFDANVVAKLRSRQSELKNEIKSLRDELTASHRTTGGVAEELARQAAWARFERRMSTYEGHVKFAGAARILEEAAKAGDVATLQAARRELPTYLLVNGETMPTELAVWLDIQAGPPEAVAAREIELASSDALTVADRAIYEATRAATTLEFPPIVPNTDAVDGYVAVDTRYAPTKPLPDGSV